MACRAFRGTANFGADAVMAREPIEREAKHDLRGALRPAALPFDGLQAFQETAHIQEYAREFRADSFECCAHALFRREHRIAESTRARTGRAPALRDRRDPVRGDARRQSGAREVRTQALACLKLRGIDERFSARPAPLREPGERAFRLIREHGINRIVANFFPRHDAAMLQKKRLFAGQKPRKMRASGLRQRNALSLASHEIGGYEHYEAACGNRQTAMTRFEFHPMIMNALATG